MEKEKNEKIKKKEKTKQKEMICIRLDLHHHYSIKDRPLLFSTCDLAILTKYSAYSFISCFLIEMLFLYDFVAVFSLSFEKVCRHGQVLWVLLLLLFTVSLFIKINLAFFSKELSA